MPTITFNGKTYDNIEEMPATERPAYENTLTNGNVRSAFSTILSPSCFVSSSQPQRLPFSFS